MKLAILMGFVVLVALCSAAPHHDNEAEHQHGGHVDHSTHQHHTSDAHEHNHENHGHLHNHEHGPDDDHTGHIHGVDCHRPQP